MYFIHQVILARKQRKNLLVFESSWQLSATLGESFILSLRLMNVKQEKLWKPIFVVFGVTWSGIKPESNVAVAEALSTRSLMGSWVKIWNSWDHFSTDAQKWIYAVFVFRQLILDSPEKVNSFSPSLSLDCYYYMMIKILSKNFEHDWWQQYFKNTAVPLYKKKNCGKVFVQTPACDGLVSAGMDNAHINSGRKRTYFFREKQIGAKTHKSGRKTHAV